MNIETLNDLLQLSPEKVAHVLAVRCSQKGHEKTAAGEGDNSGGMLSSLGQWIQNNPVPAGAILGGLGLGAGSAASTYLANRNRDEKDQRSTLNSLLSGAAVGAALGGGGGAIYSGLTGRGLGFGSSGGTGGAGGSGSSRTVSFRGPDGQVYQIDRSRLTPELHQQIETITNPTPPEIAANALSSGIPNAVNTFPLTTLGLAGAGAQQLWNRSNRITDEFTRGVQESLQSNPSLAGLTPETHYALARGHSPQNLRSWADYFRNFHRNSYGIPMPTRMPGSNYSWMDFLGLNSLRNSNPTEVLHRWTTNVPGNTVETTNTATGTRTTTPSTPVTHTITRQEARELSNRGRLARRTTGSGLRRNLAGTAALVGLPLLADLFMVQNYRSDAARREALSRIIRDTGATQQQP